MTDAVRQLIEAFDTLSDAEKHQASAELLRRAAEATSPELPDQALVEAAEELFLELDRREAADGHP